eukprot:13953861-Heterocapsa_arctica.AAC.1
MQNERSSLEDFKMSRDADESEKDVPDTEIVDSRGARLIARQVKYGLDTFAATVTSVGARMLNALLAEKNNNGENWIAVFGD